MFILTSEKELQKVLNGFDDALEHIIMERNNPDNIRGMLEPVLVLNWITEEMGLQLHFYTDDEEILLVGDELEVEYQFLPELLEKFDYFYPRILSKVSR